MSVSEFQPMAISEQVAEHLRKQIFLGRWSGTMPGRSELAEELGINHKTVERALRQLETEGLLVRRGQGKPRGIELPGGRKALASLRVGILPGMGGDRHLEFMVDLQHRLTEEGHMPFYTSRSLYDLGMEVSRVARLVEQTPTDAWIVIAGSGEVLEWFAGRITPVFALFGRRYGLPVAGSGPDKAPAYVAATRALLDLGHRRIVLLAFSRQRVPEAGKSERAFLSELEAAGIEPGAYHLPDWEETREGFQARLDALFRTTPPTALIVDSVPLFGAAQQFLASRGLRVPQDVSVISTDNSEAFWWCCPPISHMRWDSRPVVRRVVSWAAGIARGKRDRRQTSYPAEFIRGGTIGPVNGDGGKK